MKRRLLLQTNPPWLKTGLGSNAKALLKYLYKQNKYDIAHYCSQTSISDHNLNLTPWRSFGCLPTDPNAINELNRDPGKARDASYGSWNIDNVVKEWKPDIYLGIDDPWAFGVGNYMDKPWWGKVNSMLHITLDSLPILEQALEQATKTKNYFTWVKFAADEMKKFGSQYNHVRHIYASLDTNMFSPISEKEKIDLRNRFKILQNTVLFNFVFRNQLRKSANLVLDAFSQIKKENPEADIKLHFHTSVAEQGMGWNFPKMIKHYGIKNEDVLFTYICKHCGQWCVSPYIGENIDCPFCGQKQSLITPTITNGVNDDEMRYLYGLSDASLSIFTSGGFEMASGQALLCGQPLACTNYFCGVDFCEQDFVHSVEYHPYHEAGTNFIKAASDVNDIKRYIRKIWKSSKRDLAMIGEKGRLWAIKSFSIENIGAQWEQVFDATIPAEWSSIDLTPKTKNDQFPFPQIEDEDVFISTLYKEILNMVEAPHGEGFRHWRSRLKEGMRREDIYAYFLSVARDENNKSGATKSLDFWSLIDKTTGKKRALLVQKESAGDCLIITQLLESFHREYSDHDLYLACDPKFFDIFAGNPNIFKVLNFIPAMNSEMAMCGAGHNDPFFHVYLNSAIPTQHVLGYLNSSTAAMTPHLKLL